MADQQDLYANFLQRCQNNDPTQTGVVRVSEFKQTISTIWPNMNPEEITDEVRKVLHCIEGETNNINYGPAIEFLRQNS